jgi:4'-phosphopantetheinyl transferase
MDKTRVLGIDIEKIGTKPDKGFLKIAFTKKEIAHLKNNAASIFKNWTIKEAYLKQIKKGFNENLHKVEVIDNEIWHNQNRVNVEISSTIIDDNYVLSLVTD